MQDHFYFKHRTIYTEGSLLQNEAYVQEWKDCKHYILDPFQNVFTTKNTTEAPGVDSLVNLYLLKLSLSAQYGTMVINKQKTAVLTVKIIFKKTTSG